LFQKTTENHHGLCGICAKWPDISLGSGNFSTRDGYATTVLWFDEDAIFGSRRLPNSGYVP
jgi:hypothetical protein